MREDLLGYLLGALEPDEVLRIEELLESDPEARAELQRIEASLRPLEGDEEVFEPPADLISKTFDRIDNVQVEPSRIGESLTEAKSSDRERALDRWRVPDLMIAAVSLIAIGGLLFPAILEGRFEARRQQCQSNLRDLGTALAEYAMADEGERLPSISLNGPLAFAGIYSVELKDRQFINSDSLVWCPSRERTGPAEIPSKAQLVNASQDDLAEMQRFAGGHLAYNLGVRDGSDYRAPRYQGRSTFALLGDARIRTLDGWELAHGGRGYNLLFEDGRVRFIPNTSDLQAFDHPFVNELNQMEAGVNINDASLGESSRAPYVWVKQSN